MKLILDYIIFLIISTLFILWYVFIFPKSLINNILVGGFAIIDVVFLVLIVKSYLDIKKISDETNDTLSQTK